MHTWGQNLQHHPHVHCVVPGGGIAPDGEHWSACRPGFFLPVRVLSRLFRRLFLDQLRRAFDVSTLRGPLLTQLEGLDNLVCTKLWWTPKWIERGNSVKLKVHIGARTFRMN
ncbi:hypothetical protein GGD70_008066 [Paraburkholderia fungorum]|nr:hypothetical protein [Paraburkholderia fungorum]